MSTTSARLDNRLKVYRAMHDLTQEKLAERVGVTRKTINTIERGVFVPSTELALKLARALDAPVEALFQLPDALPVETAAPQPQSRSSVR